MLLKNRFIHIILALVFLLAPINAHAQTTFDIDAFNALASRAEKAVYGGETSNEALEKLRMSLIQCPFSCIGSTKFKNWKVKNNI
jgi:hypothetical protein